MNFSVWNWFFVTIDSIISDCFSDATQVSTLLARISVEKDSLGFDECGDFFFCAFVQVSVMQSIQGGLFTKQIIVGDAH